MLKKILNILKAPSAKKLISQDLNIIKLQYKYWRLRLMYSMIIGYAAFYMVRLNFSMAMPYFLNEFHLTEMDLGIILSIFSIIYGIGKFINGIFADRSNARFFMATGLCLSGVMSILLGFSSGILSIGFLWLLNAYAQSMGWPPCARMLTKWYTPKERGTMWGIWNSSHQIGGAITFALSGVLISYYGWRAAFIIPGILVICISLFLINRLRDTPASLGLPDIEKFKTNKKLGTEKTELTFKEAFNEHILPNKMLWCICMANFFVYIVRMGILTWAPTFLMEAKGINLISAGFSSAGFEIAGIFGALLAGIMSDFLFKGRRGPVNTIFSFILSLGLIALYAMPANYFMLSVAVLAVIGFLVYGPQMLVGVAAADVASSNAAATATGLTGTFGYAGSAVCGALIGVIVSVYGWNYGFMLFIVSALIATLLFSFTWRATSANLSVNK